METETDLSTEAEEIGESLDNLKKNNVQALEKPGSLFFGVLQPFCLLILPPL